MDNLEGRIFKSIEGDSVENGGENHKTKSSQKSRVSEKTIEHWKKGIKELEIKKISEGLSMNEEEILTQLKVFLKESLLEDSI